MLEQILPLVIQLTTGGHFDHRQQPTEGRFTAARFTYYCQRFATFKVKRNAVQRLHQTFRREHTFLHRIMFFQVDSLQQRLLRGGLMRTHSVGLPASSSG
ncbi:hypothetical protein [Escherichia coli IS1]|nr:hypothetical protein [Escherichia coli IS1]